jgi:hypothetical protein
VVFVVLEESPARLTLSVDRLALDALIGYLTGVRAEWQARTEPAGGPS